MFVSLAFWCSVSVRRLFVRRKRTAVILLDRVRPTHTHTHTHTHNTLNTHTVTCGILFVCACVRCAVLLYCLCVLCCAVLLCARVVSGCAAVCYFPRDCNSASHVAYDSRMVVCFVSFLVFFVLFCLCISQLKNKKVEEHERHLVKLFNLVGEGRQVLCVCVCVCVCCALSRHAGHAACLCRSTTLHFRNAVRRPFVIHTFSTGLRSSKWVDSSLKTSFSKKRTTKQKKRKKEHKTERNESEK